MQTEAMVPEAARIPEDLPPAPGSDMPVQDEVMVFKRADGPPIRVRARPGPSLRRSIAGQDTSISMWSRASGGIILAVAPPFARSPLAELIMADSLCDAAAALEARCGATADMATAATDPTGSLDAVLHATADMVRRHSAHKAFLALVSDFLALLGAEAEIAVPPASPRGDVR